MVKTKKNKKIEIIFFLLGLVVMLCIVGVYQIITTQEKNSYDLG